jgi:predicted peroxiredoxin
MFVTLAQYSGCDTIVYCVQDGADALVKGAIREEGLPPGVPTFEQRLREAREAGVRFPLCEQVAMNRHLTEKDLIAGVEIAGGIHLIVCALKYDGMLFFGLTRRISCSVNIPARAWTVRATWSTQQSTPK